MEIRDAIADLGTMSIGLFHPDGPEARLIAQQLQRLTLSCDHQWPPTLEKLHDVDVVILSLVPEIVTKFDASVVREFRKKIVISVVGYESPTVLSLACRISSSALLYSPVKPFGVLSSIVLALSKYKAERELLKRIQKLEGRLESVRLIEQAKRFLMENRGMNEDGAFRFLRNRAMEKRCSMEEVASSLVEARDALEAALGDAWQPGSSDKTSEQKPVRRVK